MILYFQRLICLDVVEIEALDTTDQISCEGEEIQYYFSLFHHPGKTTDELRPTPRVFAEGNDLPVSGQPPLG